MDRSAKIPSWPCLGRGTGQKALEETMTRAFLMSQFTQAARQESPADSLPAGTLSPSALKASRQREDSAGSKDAIIHMGL